jgi:bifunctional non-homologous end joining protein LigD
MGLGPSVRERPYQGGRQKHWIKEKNRSHPAMDRELREREQREQREN